jgi:hypothetical protein
LAFPRPHLRRQLLQAFLTELSQRITGALPDLAMLATWLMKFNGRQRGTPMLPQLTQLPNLNPLAPNGRHTADGTRSVVLNKIIELPSVTYSL